ncbi:acyl carrier protein [Granulicella sp. dw_53]|uniref:acyl carrier protein n=1 Tax=Granulicella sp. dw_53 TaxID=2719792 RepID=UPI001BD652E8|nr:acyl carrier protein [Granulicella sp. dw_53]
MDIIDDDVARRCIDIIAKSKNIPLESISLESTFDSLNIDSLDKINISFEVEEAFDIEIPDDALGSLKTVGDVVSGVRAILAKTRPAASSTAAAIE